MRGLQTVWALALAAVVGCSGPADNQAPDTTPASPSGTAGGLTTVAFEVTGSGELLAVDYGVTGPASGGRSGLENVPQPPLPWRATLAVSPADLAASTAKLEATPIIGSNSRLTLRVLVGDQVIGESTQTTGLAAVTLSAPLTR